MNDSWAIGYTFAEHNHPMNSDPFQYIIHRDRRPGHAKSVEIARGLRGEMSYKKALRILKNHDLNIDQRKFYNLKYKEEQSKPLGREEQLSLLLRILDQEEFRVRVQHEYDVNDLGMC